MKSTPAGWPRISSGLWYEEPHAAIEWLCRALGFELRLLVKGQDGKVEHSELTLGDGLIMVGGHKPEKFPHAKPPSLVAGANTQNMMVFVDDVDAHCKRAREAGATITMEPQTHDYGPEHWVDRTYECRDVGGHHWWFVQRLRTKGEAH
jgi:uncharacterized glyoxalase superfamily protein PhnB